MVTRLTGSYPLSVHLLYFPRWRNMAGFFVISSTLCISSADFNWIRVIQPRCNSSECDRSISRWSPTVRCYGRQPVFTIHALDASTNGKETDCLNFIVESVDMNTDRFSTYRIGGGNHQCFMYVDIKGPLGYQSYPLLIFADLLGSAYSSIYTWYHSF